MRPRGGRPVLGVVQARSIEYSIIGLCILALGLIFQPFSLALFGIGAVLVVICGLAFNLVPLCRPGIEAVAILRAAGIVVAVLLVVTGIAVASAHLYGVYLQTQ